MPGDGMGVVGWSCAAAVGMPLAWYLWSSLRPREAPKATAFDTYLRPGALADPQPKQAPQRRAADFASYLRQPEAGHSQARDSSSFGVFLKKAAPPKPAGLASAAPAAAGDAEAGIMHGPQPHQAVVTVLYGTEYGFSKEIAQKLAAKLSASHDYWPRLLDMADLPEGLPGLASEQALLAVCSTQGDGVAPSEAREFCDWLGGASAPALPGLAFSVCALGDTSYTHFCACGKALDARLEALGAGRLAPRADVNREDWAAIDAWIGSALAGLSGLGLKPASDTPGAAPADSGNGAPKKRRWGKGRPYFGRMTAMEGLCNLSKAGDKDTVRVEVDLGDSGLRYAPGDALGILPANCPQAVEELLCALRAPGDTPVPVPSWHYEEDEPRQADTMLLRDALTLCYDLRCPKPELLQVLLDGLQREAAPAQAAKAQANGHVIHANGSAFGDTGEQPSAATRAEQLRSLIKAGPAAVEAYMEPRHVVDMLEDAAGTAAPPLDKVLGALRPLLPRLYSISSSQLEAPGRVAATVAVVRYESLNRRRIGVTSTQLAERLQVGGRLPVYVHANPDFRLPADPATPIIMVGPGTGLAPFRAFMQERLLAAEARGGDEAVAKLGEAVLYFGCRRRDQDYLYGALLERWAAEGKLTLFTAFSRQQAHKVYVQDRLRESGALVWRLLRAGAHFYVCGDAAHMAGAVEDALLAIIESHQGGGLDAARDYLADLASQQRYQRDIWW